MDKLYYYVERGNSVGPLTLEELKSEAKLTRDTLIWYEGLTEWQKADTIVQLSEYFTALGPPPPIPPIPTPPHKPFMKADPKPDIAKKALPLSDIRPQYKKTDISAPQPVPARKPNARKIIVIVTILVVGLIALFIFSERQVAEQQAAVTEMRVSEAQGVAQRAIQQAQQAKQQAQEANQQVRDVTQQAQAAEEARLRQARSLLPTQLGATTNRYNSPLFGGISNLSITVFNNSDYMIDNIRVRVSYIKSNGETYKTEFIYFQNIKAHGSATLKAPDSDRGAKVSLLIDKYRCSALGVG